MLEKYIKVLVLFSVIILSNIKSNILVFKDEYTISKHEIKGIVKENYIAILEIKKINLYKEIYPYQSQENTVDKNIELLANTLPDEINGNVILASHSGNNYNAYFNNINKLSYGDRITIYYDNNVYNYNVINTYEIEKTGNLQVMKTNANILTLITCKNHTNKQIVIISRLESVE